MSEYVSPIYRAEHCSDLVSEAHTGSVLRSNWGWALPQRTSLRPETGLARLKDPWVTNWLGTL